MEKAKKTNPWMPRIGLFASPWLPRIGLAFSIFALVLLAPIFAQQDYGTIKPSTSLWSGQDPRLTQMVHTITIGMGLAVFAVSVLYMALGILRSSEYEAQLKGELFQLVITIIWGIAIFTSAFVINNILTLYAGGDIFQIASNYVARVNCLSVSTIVKLEGMKLGAQYMSGLMGKYYAGAWGFKVPVMPGMEVVERLIDTIQMLMTPFGASLMVQQLGLQIIKATALVYLLPAGILLRLFPMTREAGSFMMACAFAFYFVLPFTYIIHAQVMNELFYSTYGYNMCGGFDASGGEWLQSFDMIRATSIRSLSPIDPSTFDGLNRRFPYNIGALLDPMEQIGFVAMQSVFLPALSMVFVVTFIRTITKFFSSRMD